MVCNCHESRASVEPLSTDLMLVHKQESGQTALQSSGFDDAQATYFSL